MNKTEDKLCKELGICDSAHALLWEYTCGTLDESFNLLVESLLDVKPQTRQIMQQFETIAGSMLESCCLPENMREDSLTKVLAAMDCAESTARREKTNEYDDCGPSCRETAQLPPTLRHYIKNCGKSLKWRKIGGKLAYCKLPVLDKKHSITIMKAQPGTRIPDHKHHGTEVTLVLSGAFRDKNGEYKQGDLLIAECHTHHEPTASGSAQCLCLVISDAPVEFTGRFTRLLNIMRF